MFPYQDELFYLIVVILLIASNIQEWLFVFSILKKALQMKGERVAREVSLNRNCADSTKLDKISKVFSEGSPYPTPLTYYYLLAAPNNGLELI